MVSEEEELPSPDELMPITQSLITPHLAMAFDIRSPESSSSPPVPRPVSELGVADDSARTLKRPRLVWTPELHKRFVDAVTHLGIKNAVPKTIMQLMSVDGLTRENVASHLQKYRLYLKRMHGASGGGGAGFASASPAMDAATDHLFATSPIPPQFLHRVSQDHLLPFVHHHPHLGISQFHQIARFRPPNGQFELPFLAPRPGLRASFYESVSESYAEDLDAGTGGRKALALFPSAGN